MYLKWFTDFSILNLFEFLNIIDCEIIFKFKFIIYEWNWKDSD